MNRAHHLACSVALAMFLSACGSSPNKPNQDASAVSAKSDIVTALKQAQHSTGDQSVALMLDAADIAAQQARSNLDDSIITR